MSMTLTVDVKIAPDQTPIKSGWRGLADFGEQWIETDTDQWKPEWGAVPVGEPLLYGCELRWVAEESPGRAVLLFWALDTPREVMTKGASFTLRDGHAPRATGRVLGVLE